VLGCLLLELDSEAACADAAAGCATVPVALGVEFCATQKPAIRTKSNEKSDREKRDFMYVRELLEIHFDRLNCMSL
jgi:hypothetical protein